MSTPRKTCHAELSTAYGARCSRPGNPLYGGRCAQHRSPTDEEREAAKAERKQKYEAEEREWQQQLREQEVNAARNRFVETALKRGLGSSETWQAFNEFRTMVVDDALRSEEKST